MSEQWKPVLGFEGFYEVSDHGDVRGVDRVIVNRGRPTRLRGRSLAIHLDKWGRPRTSLHRGGIKFSREVHVLVAEAFIGPRPQGLEVCHNDGDAANNRVSNLRFDTRLENERDKLRHGTHYFANVTHCKQGHPFSGENLRLTPHARTCRTCRRISSRAVKARARAKRGVTPRATALGATQ